jgi:methyltransferase-like protein/ubiquinone/menaquinone biosynthesis C-methylase UbiE
MSTEFSYDSVPYISTFQNQIYPDRMATLATLLGMNPALPSKCRYLELGCGEGENLIGFAFQLPGSEFVGVDLSTKHIETANKSVTELGLKNIKFLKLDVMKMSRDEFGEFDYIAAHGLFSWVPEIVREKVLETYSEMLAPNGVGYLSYNTLPGGYLRQMSRDMMLYHAQHEPPTLQKVEKGVSLLSFLQESTKSDPYYNEILKNEIGFVTNHHPASIFHDELGDVNQPFYFEEFVKLAETHKLQYLSEAEYFKMPMHEYPPQTAEMLDSFGDDIIRREQYIDFLRCRRFRQTLLVHKDVEINRDVKPEKLRELFIASPFYPVNRDADLTAVKPEKFRFPSGATAEIEHVLTKVALAELGSIWTSSIQFDELFDLSRKILGEKGVVSADWEKERKTYCAVLLELYTAGLVELHVHQPKFAREISEFPIASELVRWQLSRGDRVTTANITDVKVDDSFFKNLLLMLDGTRNRLDIKKELRQKISSGELSDVGEKGDLLRDLPTMLNENLRQIADLGLLVS